MNKNTSEIIGTLNVSELGDVLKIESNREVKKWMLLGFSVLLIMILINYYMSKVGLIILLFSTILFLYSLVFFLNRKPRLIIDKNGIREINNKFHTWSSISKCMIMITSDNTDNNYFLKLVYKNGQSHKIRIGFLEYDYKEIAQIVEYFRKEASQLS